ncbi:DUF262 domain-containing protein [Brachyspira murdochii]|uniref:DUF262 domain-containing protein n=1 Tax=Brachyspira murdochii TaxID=84378 RepID=UPI003005859A
MAETNNQDNKSVDMRSIKELNGCNFVIPSYQRGYRWEKREVEDLLNDIYEFKQSNNEGFYCLQPLVLKKISDNVYEVIDGQQRLTTIYLILKYLKEENIYTITYSTREDSKNFLEGNVVCKELSEEEKKEYITHIDFEYMYEAYKIINEWFNTDEKEKEIKDILLANKTDKKSVQFIWYEPTDKNPIEIFTRINIGKIPLTNSELIKALFLQKANFKDDDKKDDDKKDNDKFDKDLYEHTQIEIASEWDYIENTLQDNRFWGFINNDINQKYNRIDYIFEIVSDKEISEEDKKEIGADKYKTFRYFYKKWKNDKMSFMKNTWKEIRYCFYAMNKWYNDLTFYHYIGFIIHCNNKKNNILNLYNLYIECCTKEKFEEKLKYRIIKEIIIEYKINYEENTGFNINYNDTKKYIIRNFLLLYNIEYMLKNQLSNSKFPFDLFKGTTWDIEHIESQTPQSPEEKERYIENILNIENIHYYYNNKELSDFESEFENYKKNKNNSEENINIIWNKFINIFYKDNNEEDDPEDFKNSLGNLTLLDSSTNRGYINSFFVIKRKIILEKDKNSYFIPIGTKNVFLKYFDYDISKSTVHKWTKTDASNYEEDIYETLNEFLPKPNKENEQ